MTTTTRHRPPHSAATLTWGWSVETRRSRSQSRSRSRWIAVRICGLTPLRTVHPASSRSSRCGQEREREVGQLLVIKARSTKGDTEKMGGGGGGGVYVVHQHVGGLTIYTAVGFASSYKTLTCVASARRAVTLQSARDRGRHGMGGVKAVDD